MAPWGGCYNPGHGGGGYSGLRSQPVGTEQVTIDSSGTLSATGDTFEGTYSITGGPPSCSGGGATAIVGHAVNLTGVWTGTLGRFPTVVDLQMASTPDDSAGYEVSGSVKFSGTQCFANARITGRVRGRTLFPDIVSESQRLELLGQRER